MFINFFTLKYIIEQTLLVLKERTISIFNSKCGKKKNSKNLLPKNRATMLIEKLKKKNRHREMKIKLTIKKLN